MARLTSTRGGYRLPSPREARREISRLYEQDEDTSPSTGLIVASVVVVGLGILAWSYLGADLRRYLKIRSM
jgi:hypothetical protein